GDGAASRRSARFVHRPGHAPTPSAAPLDDVRRYLEGILQQSDRALSRLKAFGEDRPGWVNRWSR
ncbi:MAG: hypothetical protein WBQ26_09530, partial [Gemmatimonadaceae bacterium]